MSDLTCTLISETSYINLHKIFTELKNKEREKEDVPI